MIKRADGGSEPERLTEIAFGKTGGVAPDLDRQRIAEPQLIAQRLFIVFGDTRIARHDHVDWIAWNQAQQNRDNDQNRNQTNNFLKPSADVAEETSATVSALASPSFVKTLPLGSETEIDQPSSDAKLFKAALRKDVGMRACKSTGSSPSFTDGSQRSSPDAAGPFSTRNAETCGFFVASAAAAADFAGVSSTAGAGTAAPAADTTSSLPVRARSPMPAPSSVPCRRHKVDCRDLLKSLDAMIRAFA